MHMAFVIIHYVMVLHLNFISDRATDAVNTVVVGKVSTLFKLMVSWRFQVLSSFGIKHP